MALVLWLFLLFASLYHVLVTVLVYGTGLLHPETIVVLRDGIRFLLVLLLAIVHRKRIIPYLKRTRLLWVIFFAICAVGAVVSHIHGKTLGDMLVGAKYGLQFCVLFLTAIFVGDIFALRPSYKIQTFLRWVFYLLVGVVIAGLVRQIAKMVIPDLFYHIGYESFGDRVFGRNPPLYYLTGPGGYARLSGIFSGPNNYGYLFVGLFGFRWWYSRNYVRNRGVKSILRILFAVSVLWTLSRGAIIGIFLQLIALAFVLFHAKRKYIRGLIIVGAAVVGVLSALKRGSTLAHVTAKLNSLSYVVVNPRGYGLGSSGPSIHTGHGTILPENFFVQILIDIGLPGLFLWLGFRYLALRKIRKQSAEVKKGPHFTLLIALSFGFLGLLLEGMFLHVFEDSMVNYRFFVLRGVVYGYVFAHDAGSRNPHIQHTHAHHESQHIS